MLRAQAVANASRSTSSGPSSSRSSAALNSSKAPAPLEALQRLPRGEQLVAGDLRHV